MKKKVMTMSAVLMMTSSGTFAQTNSPDAPVETVTVNPDKHKVETNRFLSNWFVSAGAGTQMFFGDHSDIMKMGDRISPALDVAVGKWFTPGLGIRLMYSGMQIKNVTGINGPHSTGKPYAGKNDVHEQKFNFMNFHGNVMFNLSNLIYGEDEKRVWNLIPYVSAGWMLTTDKPSGKNISFGAGVLNKFRLSKSLDLNLDTRAVVFSDHFNGDVLGNKQDGLFTMTLGLSYKFAPRSWNRSSVRTVKYSDSQLRDMRKRIDEIQAENKRLKKALEEESQKPDDTMREASPATIVSGTQTAPSLIIFGLGKSTLSKDARVNLGFWAEQIKKEEKGNYVITGYADNKTGTPAANERLSKARAQAVFDCLVKEYGVPASRLTVEGKGGVDNMFYNDEALSRSVITKASEE